MFGDFVNSARALALSYNVDPLLFTIIYLGGIPLFFLVFAWMSRSLYNKQSVTIQLFLLGYLLVQPYLYVIVFGRNVPWWVYAVIALLVVAGAYSLVQKYRAACLEAESAQDS